MRSPGEAPRHSPECLCETCERHGAGLFAQRAALAGDPRAAAQLSAPVLATLAAERAHRQPPKRNQRTA